MRVRRARFLAWASGLLLLIGVFALAPGVTAWADVSGESRINLVEGSVVVQAAEAADWVEAQANYPLGPGDKVWTNQDSRAEVIGTDGVVFRLGELSSVTLDAVPDQAGADTYQVTLPEGRLYVDAGGYAGTTTVEVSLPRMLLRSTGQALYRVDSFQDGTVQVFVRRGEAVMEGDLGSYRVSAGQLFNSLPGGQPQVTALPPEDQFDQWNGSREAVLTGYASQDNTYLPPEIVSTYPDLDPYGSWNYISDYGYCWVPRVAVGWSPFFNGRWVYWRHNPTWISYDPWGWAPHHYGRWSFTGGIGWFWVPPVRHRAYWCPGAVAWYHGSKSTYWIPLAPHELYYGRGRFGPDSINVVNVNVTNIGYGRFRHKNYNAPHAVVEVESDRFFHGGYRAVSHRNGSFAESGNIYQTSVPVLGAAAYKSVPYVVSDRSRLAPPQRVVDIRTYGESRRNREMRGAAIGTAGTGLNTRSEVRDQESRRNQPFSAPAPPTTVGERGRRVQPAGPNERIASPGRSTGSFSREPEATRERPRAEVRREPLRTGNSPTVTTEPRSMHMYTPQQVPGRSGGTAPSWASPERGTRSYTPPAVLNQGPSTQYQNRSPSFSRPMEPMNRIEPSQSRDRRSLRSTPLNGNSSSGRMYTPPSNSLRNESSSGFNRSTRVQQNRETYRPPTQQSQPSRQSFSSPRSGSRMAPSGRQQNEIGRGGRSSFSRGNFLRGNMANGR